MGFIWRRRSTSIVKIVAILTIIWFTVAFILYTDDSQRISSKWNPISMGLKSAANDLNPSDDLHRLEKDSETVIENNLISNQKSVRNSNNVIVNSIISNSNSNSNSINSNSLSGGSGYAAAAAGNELDKRRRKHPIQDDSKCVYIFNNLLLFLACFFLLIKS